jgi:hypothetical protein
MLFDEPGVVLSSRHHTLLSQNGTLAGVAAGELDHLFALLPALGADKVIAGTGTP